MFAQNEAFFVLYLIMFFTILIFGQILIIKLNKMHDTIIIGAGASGLFAGMELSKSGLKTLIIEKEPKAGRKLLITGGGKCNFY